MKVSNLLNSTLVVVCTSWVASGRMLPNEGPSDSLEYSNKLGCLGFATDWFKRSTFKWYSAKVIDDIAEVGINNLRLRCRADLFGFADENRFNQASLDGMISNLKVVVRDSIARGIVPVISWIHTLAEERASVIDGNNFVQWWEYVANALKDESKWLSFNLFTELGQGGVRDNPNIYNDWTARAVSAIRATGSNNAERIIILGSPGKTASNLYDIDTKFHFNSSLMAEWHMYASGPNKNGGQKTWTGEGTVEEKNQAFSHIGTALEFEAEAGLPTCTLAWMPWDNIDGSLNQNEIESFADYYGTELAKAGIASAINKIDSFYDTKNEVWLTNNTFGGINVRVDLVLAVLLSACDCWTGLSYT